VKAGRRRGAAVVVVSVAAGRPLAAGRVPDSVRPGPKLVGGATAARSREGGRLGRLGAGSRDGGRGGPCCDAGRGRLDAAVVLACCREGARRVVASVRVVTLDLVRECEEARVGLAEAPEEGTPAEVVGRVWDAEGGYRLDDDSVVVVATDDVDTGVSEAADAASRFVLRVFDLPSTLPTVDRRLRPVALVVETLLLTERVAAVLAAVLRVVGGLMGSRLGDAFRMSVRVGGGAMWALLPPALLPVVVPLTASAAVVVEASAPPFGAFAAVVAGAGFRSERERVNDVEDMVSGVAGPGMPASGPNW